ncbi:MAG: CHAT domain-containing protein, partial [Gammaproteobacteria bacterium]|nr:CHAT domain-containing protein [Gammaproteobacteria bacterium]
TGAGEPGAAIIEYHLGENTSYAWLITEDAVRHYALPGRETITQLSLRAYDSIKMLNIGVAPANNPLAELAKTVLHPILPDVAEKLLVIVPDGALHYIPFDALPVHDSRDYLIARHETVVIPSISTLMVKRNLLGKSRTSRNRMTIIADPVTRPDDPRITAMESVQFGEALADASAVYRSSESLYDTASLARLPYADAEANSLAKIARENQWQVTMTKGLSATREAILQSPLDQFDIIHFATHGIVDANSPRLSTLVLTSVTEDGQSIPGFLQMHDLFNLQLNAELVVLSACETALGKQIRGEGLISLTRGFLHAGADKVVASLWRAQDRATAMLMTRFYELMLKEKLRPSAALQGAKLYMLKETRYKNPHFWAPFIIQGDWR